VETTEADAHRAPGGYRLFLAGAASWFGFWGCHMVIFQWLVVEILEGTPGQVGSAQMAVTLPSLLFILLGGATADRFDPTRLIVGIHLATGALLAGLGVALSLGALSYPLLIVYAIAIGTLQAFGFPARDTLLSEVVRGSVSRAVAGTTLTQHGSQVVGSLVAGAASLVGAVPILVFQAVLVASGAAPLSRLPRRPAGHHRDPLSLSQLRAGIVEVLGSRILAPVWTLAIATGVFFVGPYLVLLPLLVRDVYGGGAAEMALLNAMFPLGSALGGFAIFLRGGLRRSGRALGLGQISASLSILVLAIGLPFAGSVVAVLAWGLSGALFINAGRTLFQSHATEANRARVLSVYTLGIMGGAPLGSILSGLLATPLGLHGTLALDGAMALSVALTVIATTKLWRVP
jgi:MFS family permease